jgi:hypothetical protein
MGREGKVASPALLGNVNPRLLRHKLVYTTLSKRPNTQGDQNCIPAGRRGGPCRRADFSARPPPGPPPGAPDRPAGRGRPRRPRRAAQGKHMATRRSCQGQPTAARKGRHEGTPRGREGTPGDKGPVAPAPGRAACTAGPSARDEGLPDRYEPPAGRLHFAHFRRWAGPGGPSPGRGRAGAAARRWRRRRRRGRARR